MIVYAESSAVLAWMLGEPAGEEVSGILRAAKHVLVSDLVLVECDRLFMRTATLGLLTDRKIAAIRKQLARVSAHWQVLPNSSSVLDRSRQPFPSEPVRTLDALHLASALAARSALPETCFLSLDGRVRKNAEKLGFEVLPSER